MCPFAGDARQTTGKIMVHACYKILPGSYMPRPLQVTFFGWWSWTYVVVVFFKDKCMFSKKTCVLHFGRALTQNSWIWPIMSYLWMVGLVIRLFPVGPTFEDHPLGSYFWYLRLDLFKSLFQRLSKWTHLFVPLCKDKCIFSKKHMLCNLGARWPIFWNLFLMSNLCIFSIIIIIAPFPQI